MYVFYSLLLSSNHACVQFINNEILKLTAGGCTVRCHGNLLGKYLFALSVNGMVLTLTPLSIKNRGVLESNFPCPPKLVEGTILGKPLV